MEVLYQLPAIRGLATSRSTGKSGAKSSQLREEGNKEFQGGSLRKALARWAGETGAGPEGPEGAEARKLGKWSRSNV